MSAFRQACQWCSLGDIGAAGIKFTWGQPKTGGSKRCKKAQPVFGLFKLDGNAWNEGLAKRVGGDPVALLTDCGDILYTWNWSKFRHSKLQGEIKELLIREEILWRQHSRVQWLKEGDLNTRFFHFNASNRRRRNKISRLRDEAKNWVVDDEGLGNLVSNYFEAVFTSSQPSQCDEVARNLEVQISDEETISLEKPISPDEVHGALMQMEPLKALGPYVFHWLKNKRNGTKGSLAVKLDMSKAYDRVEWPFNSSILKRMRGLRQGDPLSPYLFILCAEVLSRLIRKGWRSRPYTGLKYAEFPPPLAICFFADDSLFFARATPQECQLLKNIIDKYCEASGQVVNYDKSEISFSPNVRHDTRTRVLNILGVREGTHQNKYLGLPTIVGRSKKVIFQAILDKITKKVTIWKEKMLSTGGKEVLIKSITQAIPVYAMSLFQLRDSLIDNMHKILNEFWHLGLFNKALLAKQGWRLIKHPDSLMARVLKARLINQGSAWNIGNGHLVDIWNDKWLPGMSLLELRPSECEFQKVHDLMVDDGSAWDVFNVHTLFPIEIVRRIVSTSIASYRSDTLFWEGTTHGNFTVRDAYKKGLANIGLTNDLSNLDTQICSSLWKATIPMKVKLFIWHAWLNLLPTV
ncbi:reverse transcriptase [Tanacetum coccineum]|uniref:Reverse transcriptase n=1 Tax=Tanacetum coccineum TaxID=301880 RepID=A0ABQ4ZQU5_9ASTR